MQSFSTLQGYNTVGYAKLFGEFDKMSHIEMVLLLAVK